MLSLFLLPMTGLASRRWKFWSYLNLRTSHIIHLYIEFEVKFHVLCSPVTLLTLPYYNLYCKTIKGSLTVIISYATFLCIHSQTIEISERHTVTGFRPLNHHPHLWFVQQFILYMVGLLLSLTADSIGETMGEGSGQD